MTRINHSARERESAEHAKRRSHGKRHPGVYLVVEPSGVIHLRWRDPEPPHKWRKRSTHSTEWAVARRQAVLLSAQLRRERDRRLLRQASGELVTRHTIVDAARAYYRRLELAPNRSSMTLRNAGDPISRFLTWCAEHARSAPLRYLDELTGLTLREWYDWLAQQSRRDGKPYKISTLNQELKPVRAMLRRAAGLHAPHLNSDVLRAAIPHTPTGKRSAKYKYGLETAYRLELDQIQSVLRAALRFDARPCADFHVASDIALMLLCGLRLAELVQLRVGDVSFDRAELATVDVGPHAAKGSEARLVHMRQFSTLAVELLHVLVDGHDATEWLSESTYDQLGDVMATLPSYGAPGAWVTERVLRDGKPHERRVLRGAVSCHDLRATCATYQVALRDVDIERACERLGHTAAVAAESYIRPPRGMVYGASSLEDAMCARDIMRDVIDAARARRRIARDAEREKPGAEVRGVRVPAALR